MGHNDLSSKLIDTFAATTTTTIKGGDDADIGAGDEPRVTELNNNNNNVDGVEGGEIGNINTCADSSSAPAVVVNAGGDKQ